MNSRLLLYLLPMRAADDGSGADAGGDQGKSAGAAGQGDKTGNDQGTGGDKGGAEKPFYEPFGLDQKHVDYLSAKGVKDFGGLIKIAQDFETVARDRNVISKPDPQKLGDWEGWEQLGWVKDREQYKPAAPKAKEGQHFDQQMFNDFVEIAHAERMPVSAVERMYQHMFEKTHERMAAFEKADSDAREARKQQLESGLRDRWGNNYDANADVARKAMRALGFDGEKVDKLNAIVGDADLVEMFHSIGSKLGEDVLARAGAGGGNALTPDQARAERLRLEADPEWMKIFQDQRHPRHREITSQRQSLIAIEAKRAA